MKKTIIIGDIHGCFIEFKALLEKAEFDKAVDTLILNGDLMDRGPDSYQVVELVKKFQEEMGDRLIFVRGSHEYLLLTSETNTKSRMIWNMVGKKEAQKSFEEHGARLMDCKEWILNSSVLHYKDELFQCAHAGVKNEPIENNDEYTLLMDHGLVKENTYRGRLTITGHIHLKQPMYFDGMGGEGSLLEYDTQMELPENGIICIDTGITEGGKLTAMVIRDNGYVLKEVH